MNNKTGARGVTPWHRFCCLPIQVRSRSWLAPLAHGMTNHPKSGALDVLPCHHGAPLVSLLAPRHATSPGSVLYPPAANVYVRHCAPFCHDSPDAGNPAAVAKRAAAHTVGRCRPMDHNNCWRGAIDCPRRGTSTLDRKRCPLPCPLHSSHSSPVWPPVPGGR